MQQRGLLSVREVLEPVAVKTGTWDAAAEVLVPGLSPAGEISSLMENASPATPSAERPQGGWLFLRDAERTTPLVFETPGVPPALLGPCWGVLTLNPGLILSPMKWGEGRWWHRTVGARVLVCWISPYPELPCWGSQPQ